MYERAAFVSASRAAAVPIPAAPVDLGLSGPDRPCPVTFNGDVTEVSAPATDLSVTAPPPSAEVLVPAASLSADQESFREKLYAGLQSAFVACAAPGVVRSYEATLRAIATKVSLKLGVPVLPILAANQFYSFFGSVVLLGPKSLPPFYAQPDVRWIYAKLAKAAAAYWHVVRGGRAVFDANWAPRMGVFWAGIKRGRVHGRVEKSPALLIDVRALCTHSESCAARLSQAAGGLDLHPGGSCLGSTVEGAVALRCTVSVASAFFVVRRASEIAALTTSDVEVDVPAGVVRLKIRAQRNDQLGVGRLAHVVALPDWGGEYPVRLLAD